MPVEFLSMTSPSDAPVFEQPLETAENHVFEAEAPEAPAAVTHAAGEKSALIVTPYGTFSRYDQDTLLDLYGSDAEEYAAAPAQHPQEETLGVTETNAREIIAGVASRVAAIVAAATGKCRRLIGAAAARADAMASFAARSCGQAAGAAIKRIPERYRRGGHALKNAAAERAILLLDGLDHRIDPLDGWLTALERQAGRIAAAFRAKTRAAARKTAIALYYGFEELCHRWQGLVDHVDANRRRYAAIACATLAVIVGGAAFIGASTAYEYSYNGKALGIVKSQKDVYDTVDIIGDKLGRAYNVNIIISKEENISFKKVYGLDLTLDDREEVLNNFTYLKDMEIRAAAIKVDGRQVAILDNAKSAQAILDAIQGKYVKKSDKIKYDSIGFAEKVEIVETETKLGNLQDKDTIVDYMLTGAVEKKKHVVESGETFSGIASLHGIKQSQLRSSNPDIDPDRLQIGQELILTASVPVLTVQTVETAEYTADIPFEIKYENTAAKYKGEQSVKNKGVNGKKQVVAKITRNNGIEATRTEISATVLSEPVDQVVLVGTKDLPPLIGTGSFIKPVRGKVTSRFGTRWGRMHEGVDFGAPTGTDVNAADGGTVTFAGWDGAYGKVIRINHGGGKTSVYAHLSVIKVKKGTKVYKGQHIGDVGNTGRSTGPHLHFEIRVNGVPKNPLNYL